MRMKKKGIMWGHLITGIIILVLLVFFLIYLIKIRLSTVRSVDDTECAASVASHSMILQATGESQISDIYCPTKEFTVSSSDDEVVKKFIAERMRSCWSTWGKGELRLFKDEGTYCHICSLIEFKGKARKIEGLAKYLSTTTIPSGPDKGKTYMDYLAAYSSTGDVSDSDVSEANYKGITIDTSKRYAVMFAYAKDPSEIKQLFEALDAMDLGATGGGVVFGTLAGAGTAIAVFGSGFLTAGTSWIIMGVGAIAGGIIGWLSSSDVDWAGITILMPYDAEQVKKLGCDFSPAKQVSAPESNS